MAPRAPANSPSWRAGISLSVERSEDREQVPERVVAAQRGATEENAPGVVLDGQQSVAQHADVLAHQSDQGVGQVAGLGLSHRAPGHASFANEEAVIPAAGAELSAADRCLRRAGRHCAGRRAAPGPGARRSRRSAEGRGAQAQQRAAAECGATHPRAPPAPPAAPRCPCRGRPAGRARRARPPGGSRSARGARSRQASNSVTDGGVQSQQAGEAAEPRPRSVRADRAPGTQLRGPLVRWRRRERSEAELPRSARLNRRAWPERGAGVHADGRGSVVRD